MKKILSVLGLIAVLGMTTPAMAGPGGHGGPGGHAGHGPHGGGHRIHAGAHHRPHVAPRHYHGGFTIHTGYPRHSYWRSYGTRYWGSPWCDYRLGWCDPYWGPVPYTGTSFSIRF